MRGKAKLFEYFFPEPQFTGYFFAASLKKNEVELEYKQEKGYYMKFLKYLICLYTVIYFIVNIFTAFQRLKGDNIFIAVSSIFAILYAGSALGVLFQSNKSICNLISDYASYFIAIFGFLFIQIYNAVYLKYLLTLPPDPNSSLSYEIEILKVTLSRLYLGHLIILILKYLFLLNPSLSMWAGTIITFIGRNIFLTLYLQLYWAYFIFEITVSLLSFLSVFLLTTKFNESTAKAFLYRNAGRSLSNYCQNYTAQAANTLFVSFTDNDVINCSSSFLNNLKIFQLRRINSANSNFDDESVKNTARTFKESSNSILNPEIIIAYLSSFELIESFQSKIRRINKKSVVSNVFDILESSNLTNRVSNKVSNKLKGITLEETFIKPIIDMAIPSEDDNTNKEYFSRIGIFSNEEQTANYRISFRKTQLLGCDPIYDFLLEDISLLKEYRKDNEAVVEQTESSFSCANSNCLPLLTLFSIIRENQDLFADQNSNSTTKQNLRQRIPILLPLLDYLESEYSLTKQVDSKKRKTDYINLGAVIRIMQENILQLSKDTEKKFLFKTKKELDKAEVLSDKNELLKALLLILDLLNSNANLLDSLKLDCFNSSTENPDICFQFRGSIKALVSKEEIRKLQYSYQFDEAKVLLNKLKHKINLRLEGDSEVIIDVRIFEVRLSESEVQFNKNENRKILKATLNELKEETEAKIVVNFKSPRGLPDQATIKESSKQKVKIFAKATTLSSENEIAVVPKQIGINNIINSFDDNQEDEELRKSSSRGNLLIVVDDVEESANQLVKLLINNQELNDIFEVRRNSNSLDFLRLLNKEEVNVVLINDNLIYLTSNDLLKAIKLNYKEKGFKNLLVVVQVKGKDSDYIKKLKEDGADLIFTKDISKEDVIRILTLYKIRLLK